MIIDQLAQIGHFWGFFHWTRIGMLLFNICAAFSEMERELIKERVNAGLEAARDKGRKGGRPKSLSPEEAETIRDLRKSSKSACG